LAQDDVRAAYDALRVDREPAVLPSGGGARRVRPCRGSEAEDR
jgi:hypothetical protein